MEKSFSLWHIRLPYHLQVFKPALTISIQTFKTFHSNQSSTKFSNLKTNASLQALMWRSHTYTQQNSQARPVRFPIQHISVYTHRHARVTSHFPRDSAWVSPSRNSKLPALTHGDRRCENAKKKKKKLLDKDRFLLICLYGISRSWVHLAYLLHRFRDDEYV